MEDSSKRIKKREIYMRKKKSSKKNKDRHGTGFFSSNTKITFIERKEAFIIASILVHFNF